MRLMRLWRKFSMQNRLRNKNCFQIKFCHMKNNKNTYFNYHFFISNINWCFDDRILTHWTKRFKIFSSCLWQSFFDRCRDKSCATRTYISSHFLKFVKKLIISKFREKKFRSFLKKKNLEREIFRCQRQNHLLMNKYKKRMSKKWFRLSIRETSIWRQKIIIFRIFFDEKFAKNIDSNFTLNEFAFFLFVTLDDAMYSRTFKHIFFVQIKCFAIWILFSNFWINWLTNASRVCSNCVFCFFLIMCDIRICHKIFDRHQFIDSSLKSIQKIWWTRMQNLCEMNFDNFKKINVIIEIRCWDDWRHLKIAKNEIKFKNRKKMR